MQPQQREKLYVFKIAQGAQVRVWGEHEREAIERFRTMTGNQVVFVFAGQHSTRKVVLAPSEPENTAA
jgi:hypothetical protein